MFQMRLSGEDGIPYPLVARYAHFLVYSPYEAERGFSEKGIFF